MIQNSREIILLWHDLPLSEQRKIAAKFNAKGCTTAEIISKVRKNGQVEDFKIAVANATLDGIWLVEVSQDGLKWSPIATCFSERQAIDLHQKITECQARVRRYGTTART